MHGLLGEDELRLLVAAVRHAREGVLVTTAGLDDPEPTVVYVNAAFEQLSGYRSSELIGRTPRVLHGPGTDRGQLDRLRATLARGEPFDGEAVNYRKDGTPYVVSWTIAPVRGAAGEVTHWVSVQRDVTAERATQAALAASEGRFRALAEYAPVGISLLDADGMVLYANARAGEMAGRPAGALLGADWTPTIHPDDLPAVLDEFGALLRGERLTFDRTYRVVRPDGRVRRVAGRAAPVRDEGGRVAGYVGTLDDVTEREALEAQLRQAQRMEAVGQLAGGVAHDFNNLLTVVSGNAELAAAELAALPRDGDAPELALLHDLVTDIRQAAARGAGVTRQLLAFGRKQLLEPRPTTLNAIVGGALPLVRRLIGEGVRLDLHLADGRSVVVVDPDQITQVLLNLAANARDAMRGAAAPRLVVVTADVRVPEADAPGEVLPDPRGRVDPVAVDVVAGRLAGSAAAAAARPGLPPGRYGVVAVADAGHGMDAATQARVFEPFFTTKPAGEGTGLGLAMAYGIVQQSRGHVFVDSAPGAGSAFVIYLPVPERAEGAGPPAATPAAGGQTIRAAPLAAAPDAAPRGAPPEARTVLVAEDDPAVRRVARRALVADGFEVLEAADGREALGLWSARRAAGRPVDVVVTDAVMPTLGGVALVAQLRGERPDLPVVLVSGYRDAGAPDRDAGAPDRAPLPPGAVWLQKPFTAAALGRAVRAAAGGAAVPR
jgi:PAS domain S-box-containing protein